MAFERTSLKVRALFNSLAILPYHRFRRVSYSLRFGNRVTTTHDQYLLPVVGFAPNITALSEVKPHYTAACE